ncbi:MAG: CHAD domain-containing protein [Pseudomonadales bacterium]|nr:CHAD domain-containing protein [Pseudomonadales bacterium]
MAATDILPRAMEEIEAKYLLEDGRKPRSSLRRLSEALFRAGYLVRPQGNEAVRDVYFDTPEGAALKAGWSLRWRERPGRPRTVTAKRLGGGSSGFFERTELEQTVSGQAALPGNPTDAAPDAFSVALSLALERGQVRELLDTLGIDLGRLQPTFALHNQRTRIALTNQAEYPRALVELSMDQVRVAADRPLSFTEFEFELRQGPERMLKDLGLVLADQSRLYPARVSKFQRGRLAIGCIGAPRPLPAFSPDDTWLSLCRAHLDHNREALWLWEAHAWESLHPEGVHQLRVACRRLRSTLAAMEAVVPPRQVQPLIAELRWLTRQLGPLRDLDVHLEWLDGVRGRLAKSAGPALNTYAAHLHRRRRLAHARVRAALGSDRFGQLASSLDRLAESFTAESNLDTTSIRAVSAALIEPPLERLLRRGNRIDRNSPPDKLHRLRIDLKKLRYRLELINCAMTEQLAPVSERLGKLQALLGAHQDAGVAAAALRAYRRSRNPGPVEKCAFRKLIRSEQATVAKQHRKFLKVWQRFARDADWLLAPVINPEDR